MSRSTLQENLVSAESLASQLRIDALPQHIAIIMDGNGRWALERGYSRIAGHRAGVESARETVLLCRDLGIPALTLYAFSLENWRRPREEVALLMELFTEFFQQHCRQFLQEGVRLQVIGRRELLPKPVQIMIRELERATQAADQFTLTLALSYGGRDEILSAVNKIVRDTENGLVDLPSLNEAQFAQYLSTADLPDPDLVIRTSGESRVSNFLLWQIAYSELYFTNTLWPDFGRRELLAALVNYQARDRRMGGLRAHKECCAQTSDVSKHAGCFHGEKDREPYRMTPSLENNWCQAIHLDSGSLDSSLVSSWLD
ncbi:MAG: isoprenyl transferase [Nitrospirales bacterium]|nr:MAG: isoprenyl transferase [Nitrospirales bacterium]